MCGCYDVADCVCFLTFFITALVALLSVQYLVVFLDSFSANAQGKLSHLLASLYFLLMTLLGCMVFAGIQRRSVRLLKWPGRLLVFLLVSGLFAIGAYLWIVDRTHHVGVHDLEGKTLKLLIMLCVVLIYCMSIHKLSSSIESHILNGGQSIHNLDLDESDQLSHPALIADFIKKRRSQNAKKKGCKFLNSNDLDDEEESEFSRPFNVASDGINYYIVMLDSPNLKIGENRYAIATKPRLPQKNYKYHVANYRKGASCSLSSLNREDATDEDDDCSSFNSITEV